MTIHYMWLIKPYLLLLKSGSKDLDVRIVDNRTRLVEVGDILIFNNQLEREVLDIHTYRTFEEMLASEDPNRIAPGETDKCILSVLNRIYKHRRDSKVLVFELLTPAS